MLLSLLTCLLAPALATEYSPSTLVPSAAPADAGTGEVGLGAAYAGYLFGDGGNDIAIGYLRGQVAITNRLSIGGSFDGNTGDTPLLPGASYPSYAAAGTLAARYSLVRKEHINVAVFVGGGYSAGIDEPRGDAISQPMGMAGVAIEGGGKTRFDASLPVIYTPVVDWAWQNPVTESLAFAELGVSLPMGEHDRIRFGKTLGWAGSIKYTHTFTNWYFEGEFAAPVITGAAFKAEVGCRF